MKQISFLLALALLLVVSCTSEQRPNADRVALAGVYGSSLEGVSINKNNNQLVLSFAKLPAEGKMVRLALPEGTGVGEERWSGDTGTLHLVAVVPGGAEVGLVPTGTYGGGPVQVELLLAIGQRSVSTPPSGPVNVVRDFTVNPGGLGLVELSWTQINVGDYNFDGEVNISDLTPMAPRIGLAYDRLAAGADQLTEYWVDGDGNGVISVSDITPIGANYLAQVSGYNVRQNGSKLLGTGGAPTVPASEAQKRSGLPARYQVQFAGAETDHWAICPVDKDGVEGTETTTGTAGPVDLTATLDIIGLQLRDLVTGEIGGFGPGKFGTRVIDPGDIVDRTPIGQVQITDSGATVHAIPRDRVYMIDFTYAPTVNLATGAPRGGSSLRGTSAVGDDELVTTSLIFHLDEGEAAGDIDVTIEAAENPEGGYLVDVIATMSLPGDNPRTPVVEDGYVLTPHARQYYADALVSRDTDGNGSFDDNVKVCDPDRDAVGEGLRELLRTFDDDDDGHAEGEEIEIEGVLAGIDFCDTTVSLEPGFVVESGTFDPAPGLLWYFSEETEFIERNDQYEDGIVVGPQGFVPGETLSVDLYPIQDAAGGVIGYWVEKVKRDLRT